MSKWFKLHDDREAKFGKWQSKWADGTKGSGSGGTKGMASDGTKGSGSGGTGGSCGKMASSTKSYHNGGVEGHSFSSWYDEHLSKFFCEDDGKGSGTGGTKGSGTGGTKGSGTGGTKGSGTGGTKGSGTGGTKGSGTGGTHGGGTGGSDDCAADPVKMTMTFMMGDRQIDVNVTEGDEGTLFFDLRPTDPDAPDNIDIDGLFFNLADDSGLTGLNFFPDGMGVPVTDIQASANSVSVLTNGQGPGSNFDAAVQFGQVTGSTEGEVESATFTLWSENGPLSFEDIDLNSMQVVVNSDGADPQVLSVTSVSQNWDDEDGDNCETDGTGGTNGSGTGGTKGSGTGGTKGSGTGGTKGSGNNWLQSLMNQHPDDQMPDDCEDDLEDHDLADA